MSLTEEKKEQGLGVIDPSPPSSDHDEKVKAKRQAAMAKARAAKAAKKASLAVAPVEAPAPVDVPATPEVERAKVIVTDLEMVEKERLKRDVDIAEKAHARLLSERKETPEGFAVGASFGRDERLELIKRHVPEAIPKTDARGRVHDPAKGVDGWNQGATMFVLFDGLDKHKKHLNEGYIPVVHEGEHVKDGGGDLMYKRDIQFKRDQLKASSAMSDNWLKAPDADMRAAAEAGGGETLPRQLTITQGSPK